MEAENSEIEDNNDVLDYRVSYVNNSLDQLYSQFRSITESRPALKLKNLYLNSTHCENALFGDFSRIDSLIDLTHKFAKKAVENMGTGRPIAVQKFIPNYSILSDEEYLQKVIQLTNERVKIFCIDCLNRREAKKLEYELYYRIADLLVGFKSQF